MAGSYRGQAIELARVDWEPWADPTQPFDATIYGDVEILIEGTITTPYQPQRNATGSGATFFNTVAQDDAGSSYSTISAPGIYSLPGNCFVRLSGGAGSGISILRRAAA